jgi:hypothetical protein
MLAVTFALARYTTFVFYARDRHPHICWRFVILEIYFEYPRELSNIVYKNLATICFANRLSTEATSYP